MTTLTTLSHSEGRCTVKFGHFGTFSIGLYIQNCLWDLSSALRKFPKTLLASVPEPYWIKLNLLNHAEPYWTIMNLNTNGIPSGSDNNDNLPPCCTRDRSIIFHWPPPHLTDPLNQHLSIVQKRICPFFPELRILSNLAPFKMVISF